MDAFQSTYRRFAFGALLLVALALGFAIILPFLPAILWATVLSVLTYPIYAKSKARLNRIQRLGDGSANSLASLWTTMLTLFIVCIPFLAIGGLLYAQVKSIGDDLDPSQPQSGTAYTRLLQEVDTAVKPVAEKVGMPKFRPSEYLDEHRTELVAGLRAPVSKALSTGAFTLLTIVIALLTMFFMLKDGEKLRGPAYQLIPLPREKTEAIFRRVVDTIRAVFVGTVLVAIIQGAVIGATYYFTGVPGAPLLGIISMMLCIIPLLGAPVIYVPVGLWLILQGKMVEGIVVLGVGFVIVSQIDNVLKPFLIGNKVNLHPMAVFFSIFGGVLIVGPIGLMAGPMILTICLALLEVVREKLKTEAAVDA